VSIWINDIDGIRFQHTITPQRYEGFFSILSPDAEDDPDRYSVNVSPQILTACAFPPGVEGEEGGRGRRGEKEKRRRGDTPAQGVGSRK
jgi:hypothetical protein